MIPQPHCLSFVIRGSSNLQASMIYADVQSVLQLKNRQRSGQAGTHCFLVADSDGRVCLRRPLQGDWKSSAEPIVDFCQQPACRCPQSCMAAVENWRGEMLRLKTYINLDCFRFNCCCKLHASILHENQAMSLQKHQRMELVVV